MLIISAHDIDGLVTRKEAVDTMEEAFRIQEESTFFMPDRMHVDVGENTLLLMPAFYGSVFSTKMVSLFPGNTSKGLPPLYGTVILNNGETGEPLALFNGAALTALRTGAVGGVAIRHMTPEKRVSTGIIGAGTQGLQQALFACSELDITSLQVFDPNPDRLYVFKNKLREEIPALNVEEFASANDVVRSSDVVITATNSFEPVFSGQKKIVDHTTFIAIGSYKPNMQELPDAVFAQATQVFIDTAHAMRESGDLVQPLEDGVLNDSRIFLLGELITGRVPLENHPVKVFKSVGMALFDLVMANLLFKKARATGRGTTIEL